MKCLLYSSNFENKQELFNHYLIYHNVDKSNWFFKKLLLKIIRRF